VICLGFGVWVTQESGGQTCIKNLPWVVVEVFAKFGGDWSDGSHVKEGHRYKQNYLSSMYIKVTVCTYIPTCVPFSRSNRQTNLHQILHRPPHQVLNTSMTEPSWPPDPGVPQTLEPKWVMGEKTLCNIKCPDGWRKLIKFFPGSAGAWLASIYINRERERLWCTVRPLIISQAGM